MSVVPSEKLYKVRQSLVSEELCIDCKALCCSDLVMEIQPPKTQKELDTLKWYLHFKHSYIFIHENTWYHLIRSECRYLDKNTYLCKNYENRHKMCLNHKPPKCERYERWYDVLFDDQYMLENYVYEKKIMKRTKKKSKN